MERKMSLTSLDQSKLGSRNTLNRRVIIIYVYLVVCIAITATRERPLTTTLYHKSSCCLLPPKFGGNSP